MACLCQLASQCVICICAVVAAIPFRAELQRVLAEVTDHMEQQYSAHQYLEKLRSENESLALKEKERQVELFVLYLALNNAIIALTGPIPFARFQRLPT